MNTNKEINESDYLNKKNILYSNSYNNKVFRGKVITIKPPYVIFNENTYYDIFFTKTENPNYCNLNSKKSGIFAQNWSSKSLNFDYEYTIPKLNLINSDCKEPFIIQEILLFHNVTLINHSNVQGLLESKNYDYSKSDLKNSKSFISLENRYFMLEIRIKKPEDKIGLNDKEDIKECYILIVENIQEVVELFSLCKYLVYYEKDALQNHISKYIFDTINQYIRLTETSMNFFEDLGLSDNSFEEIIFPLKDPIKKIRKLFYQGKLITYFKSDNRSFFDFVKRVLDSDSKSSGRKKLAIDYSKYLYYKVIMDDEMFYKKDFKVKKIISRFFPQRSESINENNQDLINISKSDSVYNSNIDYNKNNETKGLFNVSKYLEDENSLKNDKNHNISNDDFRENLTRDRNYSDKINLMNLYFLKNVKIENDSVLDLDSVFEFFFKVLNKTILKNDNVNSDNIKNISLFDDEIKSYISDNPFKDNKYKDIIKENNCEEKFQKISKNLKEKFFIQSLKNNLIKYITCKGFFNIDIILNEEEFRNMGCCFCCSKKLKNKAGNCMFKFGNCLLNLLNSLLEINEGLIHKHFAIFSHSYNFNSKNRIYAFNSKFDASKKNKLRVYDVLFNENWAEEIAKLIVILYKEFYGMENSNSEFNLQNSNNQVFGNDEKEKINFSKNQNEISKKKLLCFMQKYKKTVEFITKDFLECYNLVLPDFKSFCKNLARFPISRYNVIDNLCQHFTNSSVQVLLNKSIMFFLKNCDIKEYNKKLQDKIIPNLEIPLEPYLINVDRILKKYLKRKSEFDDFIKDFYKDENEFIYLMKNINKLNENNKNILMVTNEDFSQEHLIKKLHKEFKLEINLKKYKEEKNARFKLKDGLKTFDYYSIFNFSHYFNFKLDNEIPNLIINYCLLKQKSEKLAFNKRSTNYSYDADYDATMKRFRFSYAIPKNEKDCTNERSSKKDEIINHYLKINKINKNLENISLMFYNYCIDLAEEIYLDKKEKFNKDSKYGNYRTETSMNILNTTMNKNNNKDLLEKSNIDQTNDYKKSKILLNNNEGEELNDKFQAKSSIINNKINSYLIVKIGHLIVNCERVLKKKNMEIYPYKNPDENKELNEIEDCENEENIKENFDAKTDSSYDLTYEKNNNVKPNSLYQENVRKSTSINCK